MKTTIQISLALFFLFGNQTFVFSQEGHRSDGGSSLYQSAVKSPLNVEMDMKIRNVEESKIYSVDYLLYDTMTPGSIEFNDGNLIALNKMNFNVIRDQFFFQDMGSKFYLLDFNDGIKKVIIGRDIYENFLIGGNYKPAKILFQNANIVFLKGYYVEVSTTGAPRTIFNATDGQRVKTAESYYIEQNYSVKEIILNKKEISNLFQSKAAKEELQEFVKENRLSYKKEDDFKQILAKFF